MTELATPSGLRITSLEDLLAFTPYLVGFQPEHSLVAVALRDESQRIGVTMRIGLEDLGAPDLPMLLADHLLRDKAASVLLVLYTDTFAVDPEWVTALGELGAILEPAGCSLFECLHVTPTGWRTFLCDDPMCCPPDGHDPQRITNSPIRAEMTARGTTCATNRAARFDHLRGTDTDRAPEVMNRVNGSLGTPTKTAQMKAFGTWKRLCHNILTCQDEGRTAPPTPPEAVAQIAAAMADPVFRDVLLVNAVVDDDQSYEQRRDDIYTALDDVFDVTNPGNRSRVNAARCVFSDLIRCTTGEPRANALAALGWIEWLSGDLATCAEVTEWALKLHPDQTLADLMQQMALAGVPPRWATVGV